MLRLTDLSGLQPLYFVPREDIAQQVLIPCLASCERVSCMVGFFSGRSLSVIAPGLASFIKNSEHPLRLLICPVLRAEDRDAINSGYRSAEEILKQFLGDGLTVEDALLQHTLRCLAYLIANKRLEVKVAVMRDAIFHPKVWLISDRTGTIAVHGSSNLTVSGLSKNFEQVSVTRSWLDETSAFTVQKLVNEFETIWQKNSKDCVVFNFPDALERHILQEYSGGRPPTEDELVQLLENIEAQQLEPSIRPTFRVPLSLNYQTGPFAHQGRAVDAFRASGYKGILEMATGAGKTITAMISAYELLKEQHKLLIIVAAPYLPLISMWCDEIAEFGLTATNLGLISGARARNAHISKLARRIRMSSEDCAEAVVITHDCLCDATFKAALGRLDVPILLIADEVHNLGRAEFISSPPESVPFRLGLSATPERQYDPDGTKALFSFFGPTVFTFTLEEAIGVCLVPYEYFVHRIELKGHEVDDWLELTEKIRRQMRMKSGTGDENDTYLQMLLQRRRLILESAEDKLSSLSLLLDEIGPRELRYSLIYATDKDPDQLQSVNEMLRSKKIRFHELTAKETCSRDRTSQIVNAFQSGELQVLTAKRVLDEGVNIPQISLAYILASTTVERQWVQRRGRLLRRCNTIHKQSSVIHDFFVVPPASMIDDDTRRIVRGELDRIREFSRLSMNFGAKDGPLSVIHPIITTFFSDPEDMYATTEPARS